MAQRSPDGRTLASAPPRFPVCSISGKRIHDSNASAEVRITAMNRIRARNGQPPYRGESFACGDHWHIGRRLTGVCQECLANLGRYDHKLSCSYREKGGRRAD